MYAFAPHDVCLLSARRLRMPGEASMKRKSFFVDERTLRRAKKLLGAETDADAVRLAMERVVEMEEFWSFMAKTRGALPPGSMETP
jgi:hypothetical protein